MNQSDQRKPFGVLPTFKGLSISPIEVVASALAIGALLLATMATTDLIGYSLFVPSLAASVVILFIEPGMTVSRSWNVIAGQFLSAVVGLACISLVSTHPDIAAMLAMAFALIVMRALRCLHPPAAATALIIVVTPSAAHIEFLFMPVLFGSIAIVAFAWVVHVVERRIPRRWGGRRQVERVES